jgi:hypothetical protein
MTVESMASPGALKHRPVLDSDAPNALGRKKGGNRRRESNASARGARRNEKLPRALPSSCVLLPRALPSAPACCPLPVRSSSACAAFCSLALPSSRALFSRARCLLLPRAALLRVLFSRALCLLLPRATAFCSRALPSAVLLPRAALCSSVRFPLLSRARCHPHSIARHRPWLGSCHPCLSTGREGEGGSCSSTGRESCLLSARGLLCSSAHGLLCSLFLGMLLCSSQLCLALES